MSLQTAFVVTGPIIKHSHRVVPFYSTSGLAIMIFFCWTAEKEICVNKISINSSNQVKKMSICHIKGNGRNPFLGPSFAVLLCEITYWGRYLSVQEPLLALDVIDRIHFTARWTDFANQARGRGNQTGMAVGKHGLSLGDSVTT